MATNFSFAETHTHVFITFHKAPKDIKSGVANVLNPYVTLRDCAVLLYNEEEIPLYAPVVLQNVENSTNKVEVVLEKVTPVKWNCLNGEPPRPETRDEIYKNDDSSKHEDMMALLRDIYEKGDDNVKKAMNKSMTESEGTVLSTDWKDVASKKVTSEKPNNE